MGFDVLGCNPKSSRGECFRANINGWRPLWDFCVAHSQDAAALGEAAYFNDGAAMSADGAKRLAQALRDRIADGTALAYAASHFPPGDWGIDSGGIMERRRGWDAYPNTLQALADFADDSGGFAIL